VTRRALVLPLLALVLAAGLIGVYVAAGGADYAPTPAADPCEQRPLGARAKGIDAVAEQVVLLGVQNAACTLGVSRERLVLALASERDRRALARERGRSEADLVEALRKGLTDAVGRLDREDRLPPASQLRDSYVGELGLPGVAEEVVRRIPDSVVDGLLPTGDVLRNALGRVDVQRLLGQIDNPDALEAQLRRTIKDAAVDQARTKLIEKIPGPLRSLLGLG
jgi:hypothetical protein